MPTPIGIDVNLNDGSPSIEIISKNSSGDYESKTYLRKESMEKVIGNQAKKNLQIDGSFDKITNEIVITMKNGRVEFIDLEDVLNQPTWTDDLTGLQQALEDISNITSNLLPSFGSYYIDPLGSNQLGINLGDNFGTLLQSSAYSMRLVGRRTTATGANQNLITKYGNAGNRSTLLRFKDNYIEFFVSTDGTALAARRTTVTFTDTNNSDLIFCVDYADATCTHYVYYNGTRYDLSNITAGVQNDFENVYDGTADFFIGNVEANASAYEGMIGEFVIYDSLLTQQNATDLYNGGDILDYTNITTSPTSAYTFVNDTYDNVGFEWTVIDDEGSVDGIFESNTFNHYLTREMLGELKLGIFAGQSHVVGRVPLADLPSQYANQQKDNNLWVTSSKFQLMNINANNNQLGQPSSEFGAEICFSDIVNQYNISTHVLKYAVGGTDLANDWNTSGGTQFTQLNTYISDVETYLNGLNIPFEWTYFIWGQGHRDTQDNTKTANYQTNLEAFVAYYNTNLNANLKWIIWQVEYGTYLDATYLTNINTIRAAQENVVNADTTNRSLVNYDYAPLLPDEAHLNLAGNQIVSDRTRNILKTFL